MTVAFAEYIVAAIAIVVLVVIIIHSDKFASLLDRHKRNDHVDDPSYASIPKVDISRLQRELRHLHRYIPLRHMCLTAPPELRSTDIIDIQRYAQLLFSYFYISIRRTKLECLVTIATQAEGVGGHIEFRPGQHHGHVFIEIDPSIAHDPIAISCVIAHESAHMAVDAFSVPCDGFDEERLVDIFAAWIGFAPFMLSYKMRDRGIIIGYLDPLELACLIELRRAIQPWAWSQEGDEILETASNILDLHHKEACPSDKSVSCMVCGQRNRVLNEQQGEGTFAVCGLCGAKLS